MYKKSIQLGFRKKAKVIIERDKSLDAIYLMQLSNPPKRRHTVCFETSEYLPAFENSLESDNRIEIENETIPQKEKNAFSRSILVKDSKTAPFHVRGRRKTVSASVSIIQMDLKK